MATEKERTDAADEPYGYELILDVHGCDAATFNRESIDGYFERLCDAIDMVRCERYWWDDVGVAPEEQQTLPHTKGTSAVQFIITSSIVIHTLEMLEATYVNIFSCKKFDPTVAEHITVDWFKGRVSSEHFIVRGINVAYSKKEPVDTTGDKPKPFTKEEFEDFVDTYFSTPNVPGSIDDGVEPEDLYTRLFATARLAFLEDDNDD